MSMAMNHTKAFVVPAVTIALAVLGAAGAASTSWAQDNPGAGLEPCTLAGVNPADHPDVFGNPDAAKRYGFVQSKNGRWHVVRGCRRGDYSR